MELLTGRIYSIKNKITGMQYIGQTTKTLAQRLNVHFSKYSRCFRLKSAMLHHGKENFEIIELENVTAADKKSLHKILNTREKELIRQIGTLYPSGYNLTDGGDSPLKSEESVERSAKGHYKAVRCVETGQIWNSVKECADFFKVKPKQISRVLKGQRKRLKWSYTLVYEIQQSLSCDMPTRSQK